MTPERTDLLTMSGEELRSWWSDICTAAPKPFGYVEAFAALRDAIVTAARQSDEAVSERVCGCDPRTEQPCCPLKAAALARQSDGKREAAYEALTKCAESLRLQTHGVFPLIRAFRDKHYPLPPRECVLSDGSVVTRNEDGVRWVRRWASGAATDARLSWRDLLDQFDDTGTDFDKLKSFAAGVGR